ncbi:MAG: hypothetical protein JXR58_12745 [Bacteroidales bacterium]|nr:hypothetical protein [Bacteroidales bacterium]
MKTFLLLFSILLFTINGFCQQNQEKAENYIKQIDGRLDKAKEAIDKDCLAPETASKPVTWYLKGYIYAEIAKSEVLKKLSPNPAYESLQAIRQCKKLDAENNFESDCINVLFEIATLFYDKGISNYNNALKSSDKNLYTNALDGFKNYFETLETLGNDDKIVLHLLKYNNINSNAVNVYAGYSAMQLEDFSKAEMYFTKIVDLDSNQEPQKEKALPLAYIYYCNMLEKNGRVDKASKVIQQGMIFFPGNPEILMTAINLYKNANDIDMLTEVLSKAEGELPDNYPVLVNYSNSLLETAKLFEKRGYEATALNYLLKACEVLNKAVGIKTDEIQLIFLAANTHNNVAKIYFKRNDETNSAKFRDQAEALYLLLLMKKPDDKSMLFQIYNNLGAIYYKPAADIYSSQDKDRIEEYLALFKKSLPYFEEAHKLQPDNRQIMQLLRNLYLIFNEAVKADEMKAKLGL